MKKINDYRKLLGVTASADLKELKTIYRTAMKDAHPDKFFDNPELRERAEAHSKAIIEAYHFLVSISQETLNLTADEYNQTLTTAGITDFNFEKQTLKVVFADGNCYEYFGVPYNTYAKMVNSESCARFLRRHIAGTYTYRSTSKLVAAER